MSERGIESTDLTVGIQSCWSEVVKALVEPVALFVRVFSESVCERINKDCLPLEIQ